MDNQNRGAQIAANLHHANGALAFTTQLFGDYLARREGYRSHTGLEAIRYYLMLKHGWLPRDVLNMSIDDLRFAIEEEMHGWTVPNKMSGLYPGADW